MPLSATTTTVVCTIPTLNDFLLATSPSDPLFVDLEGTSLSRNGTISIVTIFNQRENKIWLIDIDCLKSASFSTKHPVTGKSLGAILEDSDSLKFFWDVRNDADALWALFSIKLAGVTDIQLLENASRHGNRTFLSGLDKAVQRDGHIGFQQLERWLRLKKQVTAQMQDKIFSKRTLDPTTILYCANDVLHLPALKEFIFDESQKPGA